MPSSTRWTNRSQQCAAGDWAAPAGGFGDGSKWGRRPTHRRSLSRNLHRQLGIPAHRRRTHPGRLPHDLDHREARQDLLPQNLELHLGQAVAHAAVDAETKRQVLARARAVDDEFIRPVDRVFVAVARQLPHGELVAFLDLFAAWFAAGQSGAPHEGKRRLPADDLGHHALDQGRVRAQLGKLGAGITASGCAQPLRRQVAVDGAVPPGRPDPFRRAALPRRRVPGRARGR